MKKVKFCDYTAIEWRAHNYLKLNKEQSKKMIDVLNALEALDDVQTFYERQIRRLKYEDSWNRPRTQRSNCNNRG